MISTLRWMLDGLYLIPLTVLTVYSVHRYWEVILYRLYRRRQPARAGKFDILPTVTVQLPLYNERYVAARVIEAAGRLDYPRDRLQIQVLDDSTDESADIARRACARLRQAGVDVEYLHRQERTGFKAGALAAGLASAKGEFIAIFDADFVPQPDMLRRVIHYFTDPKVGCIQTRWEHLNRRQSLLTRCQAVFLDGHFIIEHGARSRSGRFINFNGTGGVWRASAVRDAGGWQHDTLTEDMDLSYRAQLQGWKIIFLPEVVSPAELPPEIIAFKQQQHRWTKGSVQTGIKLLPAVLGARLPLRVKIEAWFHLSSGIVYPMAVLLSVLLLPTFFLGGPGVLAPKSPVLALIIMALLTVLTFSAGTFYVLAQKELGQSFWRGALLVPLLMAVGMGISLANSLAVWEGFIGRQSEFIRTPKYGIAGDAPRHQWKSRAGAFRGKLHWLPWVEIALGLYLLACIVIAVVCQRAVLCVPFLLVFMFGYLYVGCLSLYAQWLARRSEPLPALAA